MNKYFYAGYVQIILGFCATTFAMMTTPVNILQFISQLFCGVITIALGINCLHEHHAQLMRENQ